MVGDKIKNFRLKKGYSLNQLAAETGISKSYLSYIERGIQKNPSIKILAKIAKSLDTLRNCWESSRRTAISILNGWTCCLRPSSREQAHRGFRFGWNLSSLRGTARRSSKKCLEHEKSLRLWHKRRLLFY